MNHPSGGAARYFRQLVPVVVFGILCAGDIAAGGAVTLGEDHAAAGFGSAASLSGDASTRGAKTEHGAHSEGPPEAAKFTPVISAFHRLRRALVREATAAADSCNWSA